MDLTVYLKKIKENANIPSHATAQSAGVDLVACVDEPFVIAPQKWALVPTGIAIALPDGYEAQIRPRSGFALKNGVTVLNSPGTIDADYRGEIRVILINFGSEDFVIESGMRIAQMVVAPFKRLAFSVVDELDVAERSLQGFGSTGTH
ncbi:MAG: Deoxyuridine 5'-triphosphate nucleotidohydrolase [Holosporales bacterium]